jgi:hypothetical protein
MIIDVGVPSMGCCPSWIIDDGNHRLAAAFFCHYEWIEALLSGSTDRMRELGFLVLE